MPVATAAVFTGNAADALPRGKANSLTSAPDGGWTWFSDPRAIHHDGTTYFGYVRGSDGSIVARAYDHATGEVSAETVLHSELQVDDHANPVFLRRSDGHILAFYTAHNDTTMRLRISTNPDDISAFGAEASLDAQLGAENQYDYPSPALMPNGDIHLFYKDKLVDATRRLVRSISTDGGATWSAQTVIATETDKWFYWHVFSLDGRVDIALNDGHPKSSPYANSLYHFYYDDGGWYKSDGTSAGALPLDTADMTQVYSDDQCWVWDVTRSEAGEVSIAFATFPTFTDHRYQVARWNGSAWVVTEFAAGGTNLYEATGEDAMAYSGGIAIDRADTRILYASRQVGSDWHIFRYPGAVQLTTGSGKHIRPVSVHEPGALRVLALSGTYTTYLDYSVGTIAIPR